MFNFPPCGICATDIRVGRFGLRHRGPHGHDSLLRRAVAQGSRREQRGDRCAAGPAHHHRLVGRAQPGGQDLHAHLFGKCERGCLVWVSCVFTRAIYTNTTQEPFSPVAVSVAVFLCFVLSPGEGSWPFNGLGYSYASFDDRDSLGVCFSSCLRLLFVCSLFALSSLVEQPMPSLQPRLNLLVFMDSAAP